MAEKSKTPAPKEPKPDFPPLSPQEKLDRSLAFDRLITWALLFVGIFSVFTGLADYINPRPFMNALFAQLNAMVPQLELGTFTNIAFATTMGWVAVTILAVMLGLAVWYSQLRMKAKKFSWWVPVVAAVVGNVLATLCVGLAIFSDPAFQAGFANISG